MVQHTEVGNDVSGLAGSWSWLLGQDSMHPLSWPCSAGVRNSFPSLCGMPVCLVFFFFSPAFESKVLGCSKKSRDPTARGLLQSLLSPGWSLSAWG